MVKDCDDDVVGSLVPLCIGTYNAFASGVDDSGLGGVGDAFGDSSGVVSSASSPVSLASIGLKRSGTVGIGGIAGSEVELVRS